MTWTCGSHRWTGSRDAVGAGTALVAFSAVQSADGAVADRAAITAAARAAGARVLVDVTQSAGWMAIDAASADYVVCGTYKWLLSPRGTAFLAGSQEALAALPALHAGWYAGGDPWASIYGAPLRLAGDARRLDLSPAWLCWVGTAPALELVEEVGVAAIGAHDVGLGVGAAGGGRRPRRTGRRSSPLPLEDGGRRARCAPPACGSPCATGARASRSTSTTTRTTWTACSSALGLG